MVCLSDFLLSFSPCFVCSIGYAGFPERPTHRGGFPGKSVFGFAEYFANYFSKMSRYQFWILKVYFSKVGKLNKRGDKAVILCLCLVGTGTMPDKVVVFCSAGKNGRWSTYCPAQQWPCGQWGGFRDAFSIFLFGFKTSWDAFFFLKTMVLLWHAARFPIKPSSQIAQLTSLQNESVNLVWFGKIENLLEL